MTESESETERGVKDELSVYPVSCSHLSLALVWIRTLVNTGAGFM